MLLPRLGGGHEFCRLPEAPPGDFRRKSHFNNGAFLHGVLKYPFTRQDLLAKEDMEDVVARRLDHPTMPLTASNSVSAPHNTITGSASSSSFLINPRYFYSSESARAFAVSEPKEFLKTSKSAPRVGMRTEQRA